MSICTTMKKNMSYVRDPSLVPPGNQLQPTRLKDALEITSMMFSDGRRARLVSHKAKHIICVKSYQANILYYLNKMIKL